MLNFAIRIIPLGTSFVSRLLALLLLFQDADSVVQLQADARADLLMLDQFLCEWNGISMFIRSPMTASPRVFSDAAALVGFSAIFGGQWLMGPWPSEVSDILGFSPLFEIFPIVAIACTWGPLWSGQTVIFITDNVATSAIVNVGRSGSRLIMAFMLRLTWLGLKFNLHFQGEFISGVYNGAADALSRADFRRLFLQHPEADQRGMPVAQLRLD